ncbi:MAG: branched-chain amino acid transporter AzlC [Ruminococcaceae bacterium]|nr:branched-chain amino acid transporter AzlC [Oscillospiraceae bacterium]
MNHQSKTSPTRAAFRAAFPKTVPVLAGFAFLGIAFGILFTSKGYHPLFAPLMSFVCFCGSMQYVAITLLTAAFDPLAALILSITVNARHLFYGLSMLDTYHGMGKIKPLLIYLLCDESFSILTDKLPEGVDKKTYCFAVSILNYIYWGTASLIGGLAGHFLTKLDGFDTTGFDFVLTALFVVIFIDGCREKEKRIPAAIGVGCSILCLLIFGASDFIIPAMIAIGLALTVFMKVGERHDA